MPREVTLTTSLNLNDLGAKACEMSCAERRSYGLLKTDNKYAVEGQILPFYHWGSQAFRGC
jgi:hypothetical protein